MKKFCWVSHQRTCLVLCRHHDGYATHAGDVGGGDCGGGQRRGGGSLRLAVGLQQHLSVGQLGVTLRSGEGATAAGGLRGDGPTRQAAAVVVAVVRGGGGGGGGGGSVMVRVMVVGRPVASCAARGGDDGGGV